MIDANVNIEAARAAAKRYAQLVYYHDNSVRSQYRTHPSRAWREFLLQFARLPRGTILTSLIIASYREELKRLYQEQLWRLIEARTRRAGESLKTVNAR